MDLKLKLLKKKYSSIIIGKDRDTARSYFYKKAMYMLESLISYVVHEEDRFTRIMDYVLLEKLITYSEMMNRIRCKHV